MHALKRVTRCAEIMFVSIFRSSFDISSDSDTFFTLSLHITALTSSFCISEENDNWSEYANSMMSCMSVYGERKKNFLLRVSTFSCCMMTVLMTSVRSDICSASLSFMLSNCTHFMSFHIVIEDSVSLCTFSLNSSLFAFCISFSFVFTAFRYSLYLLSWQLWYSLHHSFLACFIALAHFSFHHALKCVDIHITEISSFITVWRILSISSAYLFISV